MSAVQYPFIDVAVHKDVRSRFARGEALVLFARDMDRVLWANGAGAAFFGNVSIYDFIDQGPNRQDVSFRQLKATAGQLGHRGDSRGLVMRVSSGFRMTPIQATVEMVQVRAGDTAVLFSVPLEGKLGLAERAQRMLSGFDDPDTHMAMLDDAGNVVAASQSFAALAITPHTARTLVDLVGSMPERLLKRPIQTGRGYLPSAIGKVSDEPGLYLLFTVETILGDMNPGHDAESTVAAAPVTGTVAGGEPSGFAAVVEAIGDIEEIDEPEADDDAGEPAADQETDIPAPEAIETEPQEEPVVVPEPMDETAEPEVEAELALDATEAQRQELPAESAHEEPASSVEVDSAAVYPTLDASAPTFVFDRNTRPLRFVWKIDAQGRFCEISREFAQAVGPRAADINGLAFGDVSALFNLDPEGKIAELLKKRDTWSGKTIFWPVEGTNLMVPVDLAALPTYSRNRDFDGFRGFGIVRSADAIEDPYATGMTFVTPAAAETDGDAPVSVEDEQVEQADAAEDLDVSVQDDQQELGDEPVEFVETAEAADAAPSDAADAAATTADDGHEAQPEDDDGLFLTESATTQPGLPVLPAGEPPALRIVETEGRRLSDKVIQLEERRAKGRDGLTPHEQAAFREIARKLDPLGLRESAKADEAVSEAADNAPAANASAETLVHDEAPAEAPAPEIRDAEVPAAATAAEAEAEVEAETEAASNVVRLPADRSLSPEVVDMLPLALLVHRGDDLIHANPEFLNLTGYDSLQAVIDAGGLDALLERQDIEGATEQAGQVVVVRSDDELVPVRARLQSIRWEPDHASALMLALTPTASARSLAKPAAPDLQGERVDAARELARLKVETEELRSILETATDGVVLLGAEGDIRSMNRSASALFNYDEAETRGKPFVMLFAHESQKAILDYLNGLMDNGVASVLNDGREVIGREASGGFLPLFMTIGRLTSSDGYCAVIRDITQWKRTEEELRAAKRAADTANAHKTDFLARVSHEIRTPLNAIIGFADMMASEHFGPIGHPRYAEYAGDIGRSGRHVLDIVNDLLDISKIEAGEMDLEFVEVGLNETVSSAVSIVQPQANSQRVIIRTALSQSVPHVVADLRSIKQIVLNILANAIRFTPSGGQIIVSTAYESNGSVVLRIRDTGIGMSRSELEQAMKPFRQVATGSRSRNDGTGLGLPLTKAMVDANRATFSIHSAPNEGTLVEITFPSPRVLAN